MPRTLLKAAISLIALIVAFYKLDIREALRVTAETEWLYIGLAVMISVLSVVMLGIRWHGLLSAIATSRLSTAVVAEYVGLFGNNVFPLRLGEIIRAQFVAARIEIGFRKVLATVFLERLFDLVIVGGIVGLLLLVGTVSADVLKGDVYLILGTIGIVAAPLVVWATRPLAVRLLISRFGQSSESTQWIGNLLRGRTIVLAISISVLIWIVYACGNQAVLLAVGLPLDIELVALLIVAAVVGFMIPAAPGAIGTYHLAVVFVMHNLYGGPLAQAQVTAILLHLSSYVPSTIIGCAFFIHAKSRTAGATVGTQGRLNPQALENTKGRF